MKKIFFLLLAVFFLFGAFIILKEAFGMGDLDEKKVAMIIAGRNFRDEELEVPRKIFEKLGAEVTIASSTTNTVTGMLGARVKPDMLFIDVKPRDYDAVVFVGGSGANEYWDNPMAHEIARETAGSGDKVLGAICIAPVTLARAGLLSGKKATVWPSEEKELRIAGAIYEGKAVVTDGNIVTANGPKSAKAFAMAIVDLLKK
jgi:protease I